MLKRPLRPCKSPSCNELTSDTYCDKHKAEKQQRYDRWRGSAAERGYDYRWRKARVRHLKQNPLCVHCLEKGLIVPANEVDHVIPHKGDKKLFWDKDNWQSLCKPCHSRKTLNEN